MAMKFVINDGKASYLLEKDAPLAGKKIGETIEGSLLGLAGYTFTITGGSDNAGVPMRKDVEGQARRGMVIAPGVGFKGLKKIKKNKFRHEGMKKRKTVTGNTISQSTAQVNCVVSQKGGMPLADYFKKEQAGEAGKEQKADENNKGGKG